jgi:hypothetical protein
LYFAEVLLQLDQLRFAEGSPISRTKEDQKGAFGTHDRLEIADAARSVKSFEIGHAGADGRTDGDMTDGLLGEAEGGEGGN